MLSRPPRPPHDVRNMTDRERTLYKRLSLILFITLLLIVPYTLSYSLSNIFSWNINIVLLFTYSFIIGCLLALFLTLPFADRFRATLKRIKVTLIVILSYITIILSTTGWQYYEYTIHPELFSITEEIQKGATQNNQKTNKEKLKAISSENTIQQLQLYWLIPTRQKLQANKSRYDDIMRGTQILPIDSVITLMDHITGLPPGSDAAFYVKIYSTSSGSLITDIRVPGHDYMSSIDKLIIKIHEQLANNKAYAAELTRNVSQIHYINFLYFTLSGQVYTQSTFFQIIDLLFYRPATWVALLILSGLVDFSRQRG